MSDQSYSAAAPRTSKRLRSTAWTRYLFVLPVIMFLLVFIIFPIVYNLILSFQNVTVYNFKGHHAFAGLASYIKTFKDPVFYTALGNSVLFTVLSLVFQFSIGFALALFSGPGPDALAHAARLDASGRHHGFGIPMDAERRLRGR